MARIASIRAEMSTIVRATDLTLVWLDVKDASSVPRVLDLAREFGAAITAFIAEPPAPAPATGRGLWHYLDAAAAQRQGRDSHADEVGPVSGHHHGRGSGCGGARGAARHAHLCAGG